MHEQEQEQQMRKEKDNRQGKGDEAKFEERREDNNSSKHGWSGRQDIVNVVKCVVMNGLWDRMRLNHKEQDKVTTKTQQI